MWPPAVLLQAVIYKCSLQRGLLSKVCVWMCVRKEERKLVWYQKDDSTQTIPWWVESRNNTERWSVRTWQTGLRKMEAEISKIRWLPRGGKWENWRQVRSVPRSQQEESHTWRRSECRAGGCMLGCYLWWEEAVCACELAGRGQEKWRNTESWVTQLWDFH